MPQHPTHRNAIFRAVCALLPEDVRRDTLDELIRGAINQFDPAHPNIAQRVAEVVHCAWLVKKLETFAAAGGDCRVVFGQVRMRGLLRPPKTSKFGATGRTDAQGSPISTREAIAANGQI